MAAEYTNIDPANPPKAQTKHIWKTFFILVGVTALEFLIAFTLPKEMRTMLITIFVVLTLVKAYFIVAEFMHLGHETKGLVYSIVLPMIFVVWFIVAMIVESRYFYRAKYSFDTEMRKSAAPETPAEVTPAESGETE